LLKGYLNANIANMQTPPNTTWIHGIASGRTPRSDREDAMRPPRALQANELELTELILPELANHYGTLFGPNALAMLGKAAFLVATRYTRQSVVMAAVKQVDFLAPVPVGALLRVHARVTRVGNKSLSVQVLASFDTAPGTRADEVLRGEFEMVTVDEAGRPCAVQPPEKIAELSFAAPAAR
jgi:acyl-CoA hydrolase